MSHQRQEIREAIKAMLVGNTVAGTRVYINRTDPISQRPGSRSSSEQLPAILIYTRNESARLLNVAPREYLRTVEVVIELAVGVTETVDEIDNALDDFAQVVEGIVLADDTVSGKATDFRMTGSTMAIVSDGEIPIGAVQMTFEADYVEFHPAAPAAEDLDDLRTAPTSISLAGEQAVADRKSNTIRLDMYLVRARVLADGVTVEVTTSEEPVSATPAAGFTVTVAGSPVAISAGAIGDDNTVLLTVPTIYAGQVVTLSYNTTTGSIMGDDYELRAFTNRAVANFSAQVEPTPSPGYPLDDDGTVAANVGASWLETNAPDYLQADYTYAGPASPANVLAAPDAASVFGDQAITVDAGVLLGAEVEILGVAAASAYGALGLQVVMSNGGTPTGTIFVAIGKASHPGTAQAQGTGAAATNIGTAETGYRLGIELDGDTGAVRFLTSDGDLATSATFTPGDSATFTLVITDDGTAAAGKTASLRLIPAIADTTLSFSPGAIGPADAV